MNVSFIYRYTHVSVFFFPLSLFQVCFLFFCKALWGETCLSILIPLTWPAAHTPTHTDTLSPQRFSLVLLCSLNNWSLLQSIQLQPCNEGVVSSPQRFGDFYLIYRRNEKLLDAHTHPRALWHTTQPLAVWVRVMGLTLMIRPPVVSP